MDGSHEGAHVIQSHIHETPVISEPGQTQRCGVRGVSNGQATEQLGALQLEHNKVRCSFSKEPAGYCCYFF